MKQLTTFVLLLLSILGFFPQDVFGSSTGSFVVTAYYSPLPNQEAYIMGNYEAEIRMNGRGIRGASGKGVFSGMLAAPSNYSFGTKIYLEGLGIGEVADRGGAIVPAGERGFKHDRIDVWMGYGDEGLRRAMYWGNRTVQGYITQSSSAVTIDIQTHFSPKWATSGLKKSSTIFNTGIGEHSSESTVRKLQTLLQENNYYNGELDGQYESIMGIVYTFQLENGLVLDEATPGAGYWGVMTRSLFLKKYLNGTLKAGSIINGDNNLPAEEDASAPEIYRVESKEIDIFEQPLSLEVEMRRLQEIMKELALYKGEVDGKYDSMRDSIYTYQLGKGLVVDKNSVGSGVYGPATRAALKQDYLDFQAELKRQEEEQKRQAEKRKQQEERKKELEEKFKELEGMAIELSDTKIRNIVSTISLGDISPSVRELQLILKEFGYFTHKDTAIFGEKTQQSVFDYQVDRGLVTTMNDVGAGTCGPVTRGKIQDDVKNNLLEGLLLEHELNVEELTELGIMET